MSNIDCMPIIFHLCASDIHLRTMLTENEYIFKNKGLKYSNLKREHTEFGVMLKRTLPRSGRPQVTSDRDDRALQSLVRRMPIATSPVLKQHWQCLLRMNTFLKTKDLNTQI
jgi:hypothetical protein